MGNLWEIRFTCVLLIHLKIKKNYLFKSAFLYKSFEGLPLISTSSLKQERNIFEVKILKNRKCHLSHAVVQRFKLVTPNWEFISF